MANIRNIIGVGSLAAFAADAASLYMERDSLIERLYRDRGISNSLTFPSDLNSSVPYLAMEFKKYERRSITQQPFYAGQGKIRLPIPENLTENTSVSYDKGTSLGPIAGALTDAATSTIAGNFADAGQSLFGAAAGAGAAVLGAGLRRAQAPETLTPAASALTGLTTNPFQVVLFKAPEFRTHRFSWRFVPKSRDETDILKQLITVFKFHSLPGISAAGGVFFSYPEIIELSFKPTNEFLYKFKPCVVESVSVNYAPSGPSFYRATNAPTAIQFSINLQEIEIMTKADFFRERNIRGLTEEQLRGIDQQVQELQRQADEISQQRFG